MSPESQNPLEQSLGELGVRREAAAWLALGVGALALAGLFAILLVVARTPGTQSWFPTQDFFRTALVVHVDQSVLMWFAAFAALLWSLRRKRRDRFGSARHIALGLSVTGCVMLAAAPFLGAGDPLLNNYIPVLQHPLFYWSLAIFAAGIVLQAVLSLTDRGETGLIGWPQPLDVGVSTAAIATLIAGASMLWSWATLSDAWEGQGYFEYLFWGPGHALQFTYTQIMLVAWIWLARSTGVSLAISDRWLAGLLLIGAAPALLVPVIHAAYAIDSPESRIAFTRLMQFGNGLAAIPMGLLILFGLRGSRTTDLDQTPARRALLASLLLFAAGGLLGSLIAGVNTIIPAHYHGSIVGVTLALMGLTYHLLPRLGLGRVTGKLPRIQPVVYAAGQLLHIGGLAVSGAMGIQRKTAGAAQGLEGLPAKISMGIMGIGGLLAVIGGILFVVVVLRAFLNRRPGPVV